VKKIEKLIREKIPVKPLPTDVEVVETPSLEARDMAKEIDWQKKKEDPTFQGAFHERKGSRRRR
jgi:ATP-dependent RNA helicase RhlE